MVGQTSGGPIMSKQPVDIAFSPSVKAAQERKGSRRNYQFMEMENHVDDMLAEIIGQVRSLYLASVNAEGHPYIQHRGGPPGFLKVLDERTLGFADFTGNRQYISSGNFTDNPKAFIFLMNYALRQRVKIWGTAQVIEGDRELESKMMPHEYKATIDQVILFRIEAWDGNCPQHIPQMYFADDVARELQRRDQRIMELEWELQVLRQLKQSISPEGSSS
jgi:uncharacterized protein